MRHDELVAEQTDRSVGLTPSRVARAGFLAYGAGSYAIGVTALLGVILVSLGVLAFTGGPLRMQNATSAALFNLGMLAAFALQHSGMARESFKKRWTRVIPAPAERSTFVLATGVALLPLLLLWQPLPTVIWSATAPFARGAIMTINLLGWAYLFAATFAINHFELFGLEQSWRGFRGEPLAPVAFTERWMYRFDRHPIMTGVLVGLWATPRMTLGYLLFAAGMSAYVVIGVHFEERTLRRQWGAKYEEYCRRVPSIVPAKLLR